MLGSGIVNVTAEPVARELHATPDHVQWTVSYYLLAVGAGLVIRQQLTRSGGERRTE